MSTRLAEMKRAKSGDFHSTLITMPAGAVHVTYGCKHNICILIFYCWRCWLPLLVSFFHISFSSYSYFWCWFRSRCGRKTRYAFLLPAYSWLDGKTGRCHRQRRRRCRRLRGYCIKFTSIFLRKKRNLIAVAAWSGHCRSIDVLHTLRLVVFVLVPSPSSGKSKWNETLSRKSSLNCTHFYFTFAQRLDETNGSDAVKDLFACSLHNLCTCKIIKMIVLLFLFSLPLALALALLPLKRKHCPRIILANRNG